VTRHSNRVQLKPLAIYITIFLLIWLLRATVFISIDEGIQSALWKNVYSNAIKLALWALPALITLWVWRRPPFKYTKLTTRVELRGLMIAALVVAVWLTVVIVVEATLSGKTIAAMLFHRDWLMILAGVVVSPISEEILFRGFVLNGLNESLGFWKSNVISALVFMLVHVPYWVSKNGFSGPVLKNMANVFLLGCLFGWVMKKTNSLWPAIGAHIANNFLSGLIHA
jgi:membrane protease YdiL (CAAX protease family)